MSSEPGGVPGGAPPGGQPSEEEMRAALEAELERITVADVLVQTVVTLVNLAGRRLGLAPGSEDQRDLGQARDAIEAVRALLPVVERTEGEALAPVKDALAQLQLAYARLAGEGGGGEPGPGEGAGPGGPPPSGQPPPGSGPAPSSGRLWVPGQ